MKIFYGGSFLNKEELREVGVTYPIKLEYFKIIGEENLKENVRPKYGIDVIKTEYTNEKVKVENKVINNLCDCEQRVDELLNMFKENKVTPVGVHDVITDFFKEVLLA